MHLGPIDTALNMQLTTAMDADLHTYGFPSGYFVIKNVATNRVLDVQSDMVEDGTPVILYPETETSLVEGTDMSSPVISASLADLRIIRHEKARGKQPGKAISTLCRSYSDAVAPCRSSSLIPQERCVPGRPGMQSTLKVCPTFSRSIPISPVSPHR